MNTNDTNTSGFDKSRQIIPGTEAEFLDLLRSALDVSVGIFDKDMNYQFISDSLYEQLNLAPTDLKVGDNIEKCHELMIENGMIDHDFLENARLTGEALRARKETDSLTRSLVVTLGNGATHRFARKDMGNGYIVSMSDDVSEVMEKDKLLEDALRLGKSGYWFLDIDTQEYYLSDSLKEYFSEEDKEVIRRHGMIGIVHPDETQHFWDSISKINMETPIIDIAVRLTDRAGMERYHDVTFELVQDRKGFWNKVRAFTIDRTQYYHQNKALEAAKNEAIAATHAKSQFLANMSHEIRTPLNGVMGMAELLSRTEVDQKQTEFINIITQSATQLLNIINDILDFSKVEAGEMFIEKGALNLRQSIEDICTLLTPLARENGLEIILNYPENLPQNFKADGQRINQIITNLVGNAAKFTDEGYISVDVSITEVSTVTQLVKIEVTDTGIGIPEDKLENIFRKFTQVDGSTTRVHGGTGLGLSITKSLVELMNGRIKVTSELGKGSVFSVYLPLEHDPDAVPAPPRTASLAGANVLIVDDINVNRRILSEMLGQWGVTTQTASGGEMALSKLKDAARMNRPFDMVVTDNLMPGMNGHDFARAAQQDADLKQVPMIMLSSCDQSLSTDALKEMNIVQYLTKPARSERLFQALGDTFTEVKNRQTTAALRDNRLMEKIHNPKGDAGIGFCEILMAEDIALNQQVVKFMLEGSPYNVTIVENGKLAVETFSADPAKYAAILMDISMPVMDGLTATKSIREMQASQGLAHIPIIALTGHALKGDRQKALDSGVDDYITKPVNQEDLLNMLGKWVNYESDVKTEVA